MGNQLISIEWNLIRLGGPTHGPPTHDQNFAQNCQGVGEGLGVVGVRG